MFVLLKWIGGITSRKRTGSHFVFWIFRLRRPRYPMMRKPIGKYVEYKKSHQCPEKRLWAWHCLYFLLKITNW